LEISVRVVCVLLCAAAVIRGQKAPTSAEQDRILGEIREYALHYVERLPDYTCLQRTQREHDAIPIAWAKNYPGVAGKDPPHLLSTDVIEEEVAVNAKQATYTVLRVNSLPATNMDHNQLGETISGDTFGSILENIFDPNNGTKFSWDRVDRLQGRPMDVFALNVPQSSGFHVQDKSTGRGVTLAYKGRLYADAESKAVIRLEIHAAGFPEDSYYQGVDFTLDYRGTQLDSRRFVLPDRFELHWRTTWRPDSVHSRRTAAKGSIELLGEETNTYGEFKSYRKLPASLGGEAASPNPLVKR
jgi:hypothetical protein